MELEKIEKEIINSVVSKIDINKVPPENELNLMISQEIDNRPYFQENFQKFYIEKRIRDAVKDFITPKKSEKKTQGKKIVIMAIILFPLMLLPGAMGVLGFFVYIIIMIPVAIYFGVKRVR